MTLASLTGRVLLVLSRGRGCVVSESCCSRLLLGLAKEVLASRSSSREKDDLEEMMNMLGLCEEYLDDVVFEKEDPPPVDSVCWLAIIRVCMVKEYNEFWFFKNMRTGISLT